MFSRTGTQMLPHGNKTLAFKERMTGKSSDRNQVSAWVPGSHPGDRWARGGQGRRGGHSGGDTGVQRHTHDGLPAPRSPGDRPASIVNRAGGLSNSKPPPGTFTHTGDTGPPPASRRHSGQPGRSRRRTYRPVNTIHSKRTPGRQAFSAGLAHTRCVGRPYHRGQFQGAGAGGDSGPCLILGAAPGDTLSGTQVIGHEKNWGPPASPTCHWAGAAAPGGSLGRRGIRPPGTMSLPARLL